MGEIVETFEDYIDRMVSEGYWAEDLSPLKCIHCDGKDLEEKNHIYENLGCVEYQVWCNDCNKAIGLWSYGGWDI